MDINKFIMIKLENILQDSINRAGIRKQVSSALVLDKFKEVLEKIFKDEYSEERTREILADLKPLYLKNNVLTVASLNSSLSQDIRLREKTILYRLNNDLGRKMVEKIVFVI